MDSQDIYRAAAVAALASRGRRHAARSPLGRIVRPYVMFGGVV